MVSGLRVCMAKGLWGQGFLGFAGSRILGYRVCRVKGF